MYQNRSRIALPDGKASISSMKLTPEGRVSIRIYVSAMPGATAGRHAIILLTPEEVAIQVAELQRLAWDAIMETKGEES